MNRGIKIPETPLKIGKKAGSSSSAREGKREIGDQKSSHNPTKKLVEKLDNYAEHNTMGKRSIAVWYILKQFLEKEPEPETPP